MNGTKQKLASVQENIWKNRSFENYRKMKKYNFIQKKSFIAFFLLRTLLFFFSSRFLFTVFLLNIKLKNLSFTDEYVASKCQYLYDPLCKFNSYQQRKSFFTYFLLSSFVLTDFASSAVSSSASLVSL